MEQQHFLVVTYPAQGHINPGRHLARRLAQSTGAAVTFSTSVSGHRRMFPESTKPNQEVDDGLLSYIPFSDGYDDGYNAATDDVKHFMSQFKLNSPRNLSSIVEDLAARGRRVTCVIYTLLLSWAGDVARSHGIPSALYWIQPSTVFAIYYHYFHGYQDLILSHGKEPTFTVDLPGLPPLQIRELPSFLTIADSEDPYSIVLTTLGETFEALDRDDTWSKPKVLVNSSQELEPDALAAVEDKLQLIPVGPVLPSIDEKEVASGGGDLFKPDEKGYMEWLDSKPEKSVVYVSFGSLSVVKKEQMEEISKGLKESGRPYLWVVRKDSRWEGVELEEEGENGMVVEWCSQVRVLSHPSVGCFVTHCGWNSTIESLVCGVPTVGVPQWTDQGTNARLAEKAWGTGIRVEVNGEGLVESGQLRRCLELVMGEGERGVEIRRNAEMWRDKAREATADGGSSDRDLRAFVEEIVKYDRASN